MRTMAEFTKTTLIGGFLFVLPVYVSLLLLAKAVQGLVAAVKPITAGIPASVEFREILAILALAAVCFIAGIMVRTGPSLRAKNAAEETLLEKLPGYTLLRGLAGRVTGQADEPGVRGDRQMGSGIRSSDAKEISVTGGNYGDHAALSVTVSDQHPRLASAAV